MEAALFLLTFLMKKSLRSGGSYLSDLADTITNLPTNLQRVITHPQIFNKIIGYNPMQKETGFAAAATGLPPKQEYPGGILNPPNLEYEKGYESGEPVAIAAGAAPFAIPIGRSAGKALAPKMYEMAEDYMVKTGGLIPITAWHGTPHNIQGKFDINKVGTGEGAQHFGHGIYFAESPSVASGYKGSDAVKLFANGIETESPVAKQILRYGGSPETYINSMQKVIEKKTKTLQNASKEEILPGLSDYDMAKMDLDGLLNKIEEAKSYKSVETRPVGNLYKVDIPDEHIPNYMDWYAKLDEQTPEVKKALGLSENEFENFKIPQTGTNYSFSPKMLGGDLYQELVSITKSKAKASEILKEMGIKGNRYENFQIKKGDGGGTSNYVVFDPSEVNILEKNGKNVLKDMLVK